jgi:hypothetical protein
MTVYEPAVLRRQVTALVRYLSEKSRRAPPTCSTWPRTRMVDTPVGAWTLGDFRRAQAGNVVIQK